MGRVAGRAASGAGVMETTCTPRDWPGARAVLDLLAPLARVALEDRRPVTIHIGNEVVRLYTVDGCPNWIAIERTDWRESLYAMASIGFTDLYSARP